MLDPGQLTITKMMKSKLVAKPFVGVNMDKKRAITQNPVTISMSAVMPTNGKTNTGSAACQNSLEQFKFSGSGIK